MNLPSNFNFRLERKLPSKTQDRKLILKIVYSCMQYALIYIFVFLFYYTHVGRH